MISLLIIIYLSFVSLGLPNSMLGSAWPTMQGNFGTSVDVAGYISMVIFGATVVSILFCSRLVAKYGTGKTVTACTLVLALGVFGYAVSTEIWMLMASSVLIGLGSGCIDASINNFVALHYQPRHMSWLHCFWGLGATAGPMILAQSMRMGGSWRTGYWVVGALVLAQVILMVFTLPLWKRAVHPTVATHSEKLLSNREVLKLPHIWPALAAFLLVTAVEITSSLWCSTFLASSRQFTPEDAAMALSYHLAGLTAARFLFGFLAAKLSDDDMVRLGLVLSLVASAMLLLPLGYVWDIAAVVLLGAGLSPLYPNLIHTTPRRFGPEISQSVLGLEMSIANVGSTVIPALFGLLARHISAGLFPIFMLVTLVLMLLFSELARKKLSADTISVK